MDVSDTSSHLDLLAIARDLRRAATDRDVGGVHAVLTRLRAALVEHAAAETTELAELPESTGGLARDGQRRLIRLIDDVLFDSVDGSSECNCIVRAVEIDLAVRRQARLEATIRRDRRAGDPGPAAARTRARSGGPAPARRIGGHSRG